MPRRMTSKAMAIVFATAAVAGASVVAATSAAEAATSVTQTAGCVDRGGHRWAIKTVWGSTYTDADGDRRIQNNYIGFTSAARDATTVDYVVRSYRPTGELRQTLRRNDRRFDFSRGRAYLAINPTDPRSGPGRTKITVTVGDGDDGYGPCTVTFIQSKPTPVKADRVYTTGYTWWDNSPPGSASISHPVLHRTAGGVGTWSDPITLAVGYRGRTPLIPYGTRFYLPEFRKYFIVEDICGACSRVPTGAKYKLDLWLDGRSLSRSGAEKCAYAHTGATTAVRNPPRGLPVASKRIC